MLTLNSTWAECMDGDGYPTEALVSFVENWKPANDLDFTGLIELVGRLWYYPSCYYADPYNRTYTLTTVGWSGNETLIGALQRNLLFWTMCWYSSHRGGKHVFILPETRK